MIHKWIGVELGLRYEYEGARYDDVRLRSSFRLLDGLTFRLSASALRSFDGGSMLFNRRLFVRSFDGGSMLFNRRLFVRLDVRLSSSAFKSE